MQTLTEIKGMLAARGLRPKHRLGQNFLHSHHHLGMILDAADLTPGERVLEVGPGTGALTVGLLDAGAQVVAVELDSDLIPLLEDRFAAELQAGRLTLIQGDALAGKHELSAAVLAALGGQPFKMIANLPYQVASPLLVNLSLQVPAMSRAVVMVQKEVADRLKAGPGDGKAYGPLSVVVQNSCEAETVAHLTPGCFWPAPKVASAVSRLRRRPEPRVEPAVAFADYVHRVFGRRRKQLGTLLGDAVDWPAGVTRQTRPEALTLEQWAELYDATERRGQGGQPAAIRVQPDPEGASGGS